MTDVDWGLAVISASLVPRDRLTPATHIRPLPRPVDKLEWRLSDCVRLGFPLLNFFLLVPKLHQSIETVFVQ